MEKNILIFLLLLPTIVSMGKTILGVNIKVGLYGLYYTILMFVMLFIGSNNYVFMGVGLLAIYNNLYSIIFEIKENNVQKYCEKNLLGSILLLLIGFVGFVLKWTGIFMTIF